MSPIFYSTSQGLRRNVHNFSPARHGCPQCSPARHRVYDKMSPVFPSTSHFLTRISPTLPSTSQGLRRNALILRTLRQKMGLVARCCRQPTGRNGLNLKRLPWTRPLAVAGPAYRPLSRQDCTNQGGRRHKEKTTQRLGSGDGQNDVHLYYRP